MNIFIKNDTFYVFLNSIYRETKEQKSGKPGTLFFDIIRKYGLEKYI